MSILALLRSEVTGFFDLLFPPACPLCGRLLAAGSPPLFCPTCLEGFLAVGSPSCPRCALPYPTEGGTDHLCEACLREEPAFSQVVALGRYQGTLRQAIQHFKYHGAIDLDRPLGTLLAAALAARCDLARPDLIVPVPLHPARLRERTYNQSLLLARVLGRRLQIPVAPRLLCRRLPAPPQQGLSAVRRRENLRGAFGLGQPLSARRIVLVDDVVTTGATARECSRVLAEGGAAQITLAVLARAGRNTW